MAGADDEADDEDGEVAGSATEEDAGKENETVAADGEESAALASASYESNAPRNGDGAVNADGGDGNDDCDRDSGRSDDNDDDECCAGDDTLRRRIEAPEAEPGSAVPTRGSGDKCG
jgi:hypothetical protein